MNEIYLQAATCEVCSLTNDKDCITYYLSEYDTFEELIKEITTNLKDGFKFVDFDSIPESLITKSCELRKEFYPLYDLLCTAKDYNSTKQTAFFIWLEKSSHTIEDEPIMLVSAFERDYICSYKDKEDAIKSYISEIFEIPDILYPHIDWDSLSDSFFEFDYWCEDGHLFCR